MPKYGAKDFAVLLLDGYNMLGAKVQAFGDEVNIPQQRSDGLGDEWREWSPTGKLEVTVEQEGAFFDTTTASIHDALKAAAATSRLLAWAPAGNVIGSVFKAAQGITQVAYGVLARGNGLTNANARYQVSGSLDEGVIVQPHETKTVDWNTRTEGSTIDYALDPSQQVIPITSSSVANPSVITTPIPHGLGTGQRLLISGHSGSTPSINGETTATVITPTTFSIPVNVTVGGTGGSFVRTSSLNGAVGHLSISALAGFSDFIGKIRDSADNSVFADLVTFSIGLSAPAAERIEVAGTVDRYLSFDGNVTGTGSIKVFAGLARK